MQPTWQDKLSPSGGLLNYQWNDQLLQMELDEMNLLTEAQQARNFPVPLPHPSWVRMQAAIDLADASSSAARCCLR